MEAIAVAGSDQALGGIMNLWLFAVATTLVFHVGLGYAPLSFVVGTAVLTVAGFELAPSTTAVTWWLLLFTAVIPQIALLHIGYYGLHGMLVAAAYWFWTFKAGRFDPDLRSAEACGARLSPFWRHLANYFPAELLLDGDLRPDGLYLLAVHPHGLWGSSVWANLIPERPNSGLPRRRICTLDMNFKVPLLRDVLFAMGLIASSSSSIRKTLSAGLSVVLVVGGGREAMLTRPGHLDLLLGSRKGFVKIALETGASLVPVIGFGENNCYMCAFGASLWAPFNAVLLRTLGMSLPILSGWHGTFLPHPVPLVTVVGSPLPAVRAQHPSREQIDGLHAEYCTAVRALYDKYKDRFDRSRVEELRIMS